MSLKKYLLILFFIIGSVELYCQELNTKWPIWITTDRNIYISGDAVLFELFLNEELICKQYTSCEIYIDLVNNNNEWIDGVIVKQINGSGAGSLHIPDTLETGNYCIRTYYHGQRAENTYYNQPIVVINRFDKNGMVFSLDTVHDRPNNNSPYISITSDNKTFSTRKKVNIQLTNTIGDETENIKGNLRVLSYKQWSCQMQGSTMKFMDSTIYDTHNQGSYNGIMVSGTVLDGFTLQPIPNAIVLISALDTLFRIKYDQTDSKGRFSFLLYEYYGLQSLYFSAYSAPDFSPLLQAVIKIDDPFYKTKKTMEHAQKLLPFGQDSIELSKAIVCKAYSSFVTEPVDIKPRPEFAFEHFLIGNIQSTVAIDDYIPLNSFYEISKEILPLVKIRNTPNGPTMQVISNRNSMHSLGNNPLVLVDGIPIVRFEPLMEWGSSKLKRVDVQNYQRTYGNLLFNSGIIMIWTRKMDFWGQKSISGTFNYPVLGFQKPFLLHFPDYSMNNDQLIPDLRQVIYWEPNITISSGGQYKTSFYTSDEKGDFIIEFSGIDNQGNRITNHQLITVQ